MLFTPGRFSSLPGTAMARGPGEYASKNGTADYLGAYAVHERLPVRLATRVRTRTEDDSDGDAFVAETTTGRVRARHVVVATGPYTSPFVPDAASGLDRSVAQLHSSSYRSPDGLPGTDVLVAGAGNSAAQPAVEPAAGRRVTVAAPGGMWFLPARILGVSLYRWLRLSGILNNPSGSRVLRLVRARGDGIIGRKLQELVAAGKVRMIEERVVGGHGRTVVLADGTEVATDAVLWCIGYRPDHGWLSVPGALDGQGGPSTTPAAPRSRACTGSACRGRTASTAGSSTAPTGTPASRPEHRRRPRRATPGRRRAGRGGPTCRAGPRRAASGHVRRPRTDPRRSRVSDDQPDPAVPTSKQLRDARRQAHETQQNSKAGKGGDKKGKKGKGGRRA